MAGLKRAADGGAPEEEAKRLAMEGLQGQPAAPLPGAPAEEERGAEDKQDDELDDFGIPRGWRECPCVGRPVDRFVPMKVPLGARFDAHIAPEQRFNIDAALEAAHESLVKANYLIDTEERDATGRPVLDDNGRPVRVRVVPPIGLVIDLTRSSRYYDPQNWLQRGVKYVKIPCQGRGQVPQPEAVTDLVFEMYQYMQECPTGVALIHCTHGFNRTGYMIASYLARVHGKSMPRALEMFTKARPPGIYKHYYIRQLFKYYHERLPTGFPFPAQPPWKAGDSPEHEEEEEAEGGRVQEDPHAHKHHDDVIGEQVNLPEEAFLRMRVMDAILGPDPERNRVWLPGSQPVSLDSSNKSLLEERPYWVTWKADGTRYMLVLMRWGTYLIDRKFAIRRVQMRWPTVLKLKPGQQAKGPVGPPHHLTILDGEMVVDEDVAEDRWDRRFLAYDMVMVNGHSLVDRPWMERYKLIDSEVIQPRKKEQHKIQTGQWQYAYQYDKEAFHVRRKEFWPLTKAETLINKFIPQLCHEADGLIFQATQDPYVPGTCQELLKWKFAHMNSVDFRLRKHPQRGWLLELLETRRGKSLPEGKRPGYHELEGARVEFPEGEDPETYDMRIIECSWDPEKQVWLFMRERKDKETPNATHVYESVQRSIEDNIKEDELLPYIQEVLQLPLYDRDTGRAQ